MPTSPLVSVIVPIYNGATYLARCIESIQKQTYPHWELLLIDDGSTDTSLEICRRFARQDTRIKIFCQSNQGVCAARNSGLERAQGTFLTFADQDDLFPTPDIFSFWVQTAQQTQADIIWGDWEFLFEDGSTRFPATFKQAASVTGLLDAQTFLYKLSARHEGSIWSKLYRRDVIGNVRCRTDLRRMEDLAFLLDILPQVHTVFHTDKVVYNWFQFERSTSHILVTDIAVCQTMLPVFQQAYQLCLQQRWNRALRTLVGWYLHEIILFALIVALFDLQNQFIGFYNQLHQAINAQKKFLFYAGQMPFRSRMCALCFLFFPMALRATLRLPGICGFLQQKLTALLAITKK